MQRFFAALTLAVVPTAALLLLLPAGTLAQSAPAPLPTLPPPAGAPVATPAPVMPAPYAPSGATEVDMLNNGPCLDSSRSVPQVLQPPAVAAMQIVRIDKVVSTATMTRGEVVGFLYTLHDGTTWLAQRHEDYMSGADARSINNVLASTHLPAAPTAFPPKRKYGVKTNYQEFFPVTIPAAALDPLRVRLDLCVAWPTGRSLPDPSM